MKEVKYIKVDEDVFENVVIGLERIQKALFPGWKLDVRMAPPSVHKPKTISYIYYFFKTKLPAVEEGMAGRKDDAESNWHEIGDFGMMSSGPFAYKDQTESEGYQYYLLSDLPFSNFPSVLQKTCQLVNHYHPTDESLVDKLIVERREEAQYE